MVEKFQKKNKKHLELRMYSLVLYNVSGIQAGIQAGHATDKYGREFRDDEDYQNWIDNWITVIVKNGGTSNSGKESRYGLPKQKGTMEIYLEQIQELGIKCMPFYEPDLNYALTSISFLVDERVFNKDVYPDWTEETFDYYDMTYDEWYKMIGGERNIYLRNTIQPLPLARN